jgi:hypothetical protein
MTNYSKTVTEAKTKASAFTVLVVALVGQSLLAGTVTDFIPKLPDSLEVTGYSLVAAGAAWFGGWIKKSVSGKLAQSTIDAARREVPGKL